MSILSSFREEFIKYLFDNEIKMYTSHDDEKRGNWNFTNKKGRFGDLYYTYYDYCKDYENYKKYKRNIKVKWRTTFDRYSNINNLVLLYFFLIFFEEDLEFTLECDYRNNTNITNNTNNTCVICNILKKPCEIKDINDIQKIYNLNKYNRYYLDLFPYQHFSFSSIRNYLKTHGYMVYYQEHAYFSYYNNIDDNYNDYNTNSYLCIKNLKNLKLKSKCHFNFNYLKNTNTLKININLETNKIHNIVKILILHLISGYSFSTSISVNRNNTKNFLLSIGFEKEDFNIECECDEKDDNEYHEKDDEYEEYYKEQENIKDIDEYINSILNDKEEEKEYIDFDEDDDIDTSKYKSDTDSELSEEDKYISVNFKPNVIHKYNNIII